MNSIVEAIAAAETVVPMTPKEKAAKPRRRQKKAAPEPQQRGRPAPGGEAWPEREPIDPAQEALDLECSRLPLTDLGNAERFAMRHGQSFRFVAEWGWLAWDGARWSRAVGELLVANAVHDTIRAIKEEAAAIAHSGEDFEVGRDRDGNVLKWSDKIYAWCLKSQGAGHVGCVARLAQPMLAAASGNFDADPMTFNVNNGTLRFLRREDGDYVTFGPHRREDKLTKLSPIDYDPEALCPTYDSFLSFVQPDQAVRRHLHAWGGLSMTGDATVQKLAFWHGKGNNGKSTLSDVWAHVYGDYADSIAIESFLDSGRARRGGEATPDLAGLPGVRFLRCSEPERGAKLGEAMIKLVTGGEPMKARHLNKDFFRFLPVFKLTMQGNYKPRIDGTDEGIWRRVIFVPWGVTVPRERVDRELGAKLRQEAPGILNRLLDGLRDWMDRGLVLPDAIEEATAQFREESDPLGRFLASCVGSKHGGRVQSSEAYRLFVAWAKSSGEREWTATGFGRAMRERGYVAKQSNVMWWLDIELLKAASDYVDADGRPLRRPPNCEESSR